MHVSMILSNHAISVLLFFPVMLQVMFIRSIAITNGEWARREPELPVTCIRLSIPVHILMPCVTRRRIYTYMAGGRSMLVSKLHRDFRSWEWKRLILW